jgi:excisionase family DNA binding protein
MSATYTTAQAAELLGVSEWALYQAVRDGSPPVTPIRIGRRIVWPKAPLDSLVGVNQ